MLDGFWVTVLFLSFFSPNITGNGCKGMLTLSLKILETERCDWHGSQLAGVSPAIAL
jgi:hypothetical protein